MATTAPPAHPPVYLLAAAAAVTGAAALLLTQSGRASSIIGYTLSTFVALTCVTAFRWVDNRRRQDVSYVVHPRLGRISTALAVGALLVASMHVWRLATELAR